MIPGFTPTRRRVRLAGIVSVSFESSKEFGVRRLRAIREGIGLRVIDDVVCEIVAVVVVIVVVLVPRLGLLMGPGALGASPVVSLAGLFKGSSSFTSRREDSSLAALPLWANPCSLPLKLVTLSTGIGSSVMPAMASFFASKASS